MANPTTNKGNNFGQTATELKNKAGEAASAAADTAKQYGAAAADTADSAASAVGSGAKSLAGTVRENLPRSGMMGAASGAVADTLEGAGRYLQEQGVTGAAEDLTGLIRRNPVPAVLVGIGLGFLLARITRS